QKIGADFALPPLFIAFKQLRAVGGEIVLEEVGEIELGEELDHRLLAWRMIGETVKALLPDFLDGAIRAQARDELICLGSQPEILIAERILQDDPTLATIVLPPHLDVRTQANPLIGHPVP